MKKARTYWVIDPKWSNFRNRYLQYKKFIDNPVPIDTAFTTPAYMRMLLVAKSGICDFEVTIRGITKTIRVVQNSSKVLENIPANSVLKAPKYGAIFVDKGQLSSAWVFIAGDRNIDPPLQNGFGCSAFGVSYFGGSV